MVYQEEEVGSDDDLNVLFKVPSSSIIDVAAPAHRRRVASRPKHYLAYGFLGPLCAD